MSKPNLTFRIDEEELLRADALVPLVARDPALRASGRAVSRSTVLRLALNLGLAELTRNGGRMPPLPDEGGQ